MVRSKSEPARVKLLDGDKSTSSTSETSAQIKKCRAGKIMCNFQNHPQCMEMNRKLYKEIILLQTSTNHLIPHLPFSRLVREIITELSFRRNLSNLRIQSSALLALQECVEIYLTQYFEDAYFCTMHAKRKTLHIADMLCVRRLRGNYDIINI